MLNIDTFQYIENIIAAEKSLFETYRSLSLSSRSNLEKEELDKLRDQHKNRYNALLALLKEKNGR